MMGKSGEKVKPSALRQTVCEGVGEFGQDPTVGVRARLDIHAKGIETRRARAGAFKDRRHIADFELRFAEHADDACLVDAMADVAKPPGPGRCFRIEHDGAEAAEAESRLEIGIGIVEDQEGTMLS
jgi:hypothetical protein